MQHDRAGAMAVFVAVAEAGSLSGAARRLGLMPSAVSRIVARIEARLGVRLLVRTTRTLRLTAEGETYGRAARRILADLDETEAALADRGCPRGRVRVSAATAHGRLVIVPLLADFVAHHPGITVEIDLSDELADVRGGRADVAIRFGPLADDPLTARRLGETGRTVVVAPAYLARAGTPRRPIWRSTTAWISPSAGSSRAGRSGRTGRDVVLPVTGAIAANNGETLVQLVARGVSLTRVGNFHIAEDLAAGRLVPLLEPFNPQDREAVHAMFVGGPAMPARVRVDYLVERMRGGGAGA
ncbi:LysR family transcriptional regulator [Methylobacterium sp. J-030]|uniref:LysR family transcriptional regulator n=1 Tax=Methylobacterium sp. J-030 TaxID=2836627 RepID=UPI001FBA5CB3|nr:LysR family transcriptional regulator [Methylobacterium sp. J-030]MCJ2067506.1 LysR family transcriptional regulator [Methylobacterium sp. J-030]